MASEWKYKWKALKRVIREKRAYLKNHSGEKIERGSTLEGELKVYNKLKKLEQYIKSGNNGIDERIDKLYDDLIGKEDLPKQNVKREEQEEQQEEQQEMEKEEEEEEEEEIVIGPTPQLQGRVINLLSIEISPEKQNSSPSKIKKEPDLLQELQSSPQSPSGSNIVMETPTKDRISQKIILETPLCLKRGLEFKEDSREFNLDPSPLFKGNGRSLFSLNREVKSLKRNLSQLLEEEQFNEYNKREEDVLGEDHEGQEGGQEKQDVAHEVEQSLNEYKIKSKTIKRSTRRVKMKTQKDIKEDDEFEGTNIHQFTRNKADRIVGDTDDESSHDYNYEDEDEDEENDTYQRMDFTHLMEQAKKSTGKHPLSNNFVRMKIHKKGRGNRRFGRRY